MQAKSLNNGRNPNAVNYEIVGQRIQKARKASNMTLDQVSKESGISVSFIEHIERGSRKMSLETFSSLCIALNLNPVFALLGVQDPILASNNKEPQPSKL